LHEDFIEKLSEDNILESGTALEIMSIKEPLERTDIYNKVYMAARKYGLAKKFEAMYKTVRRESVRRAKGHIGGRETAFTDQPIKLKCGDWIADDRGVQCEEFTQGGDNVTMKFASPIPILPVAIFRNVDTDKEKIEIAYFINNEWQYITCERVTVASSNRIVELANCGLEVTSENSKLLVKYISDVISLNMEQIPRDKSISHMGWNEERFLPYNREIRFDGEGENKKLYKSITSKGTADKWIEYMKPLILKSKLLRLTVAASFASVLIERVNALPFVFHLWGGTGSGKTVSVMAAMSIWGNPKMGAMTRTMNMTANSMMSTAAFLRNLPFGGDELQIIKDKFGNYDRLIMAITEGIDRGRMTYNKNDEMKTWACSFIFTGEEPCTKSSSGGGVVNRVIETEANKKLIENGNAVVNFISENYGSVGMQFVDIVRETKNLEELYSYAFTDILTKTDTTEKQAMAMSLMLVADFLMSVQLFGISPLQLDDVSQYLSSAAEVDTSERAYLFIVDEIAKNEQIHFHTSNLREDSVREVWGKIDTDKATDEEFALINKTVLTKLLSDEGYEFEAVKTKWADKGHLIKNSMDRYIHQTKCFGIKASYVKIKISS
jgi:Superfamily II helicase and inactivated derivatives